MARDKHEIRDPIHIFVRLDSDERKVLDSRPFQRLRHIHQLALSHFIYPGATHKRFEHSLGVMELAGRVYDVVTHKDAVTDEVKRLLPEVSNDDSRHYWRRVIRMAALCHDIGHLPFSHTSEDLFPKEWDHERMTAEIIRSGEMRSIWEFMTPPLRPDDIVKLAIGPKKAAKLGLKEFSDWEAILKEIIVGDAFGVDRMDYLLRDSYHAGVAYGKFDHYRLIDTLRILTPPPTKKPPSKDSILKTDTKADESKEVTLGIEDGGLHSAEALLLARYFMFMQVYYHPVRVIYDIHLRDFLKEFLPDGTFRADIKDHLNYSDAEITVALRKAYDNPKERGHLHAEYILARKQYKVLYRRNPDDVKNNPDAVTAIYEAARSEYGDTNVRFFRKTETGSTPDFPVQEKEGRVVSSLDASQTLQHLPLVATGYVFIARDHHKKAKEWLDNNLAEILTAGQIKEA